MWIDLSHSVAQNSQFASAPEIHPVTAFGPVKKPVSRRSTLVVPFPKKTSAIQKPRVTPSANVIDIDPFERPATGDVLDRVLNATSMEERHRRMAHEIFGMMPRSCIEKLQTFNVLYDNPKQRGLAGYGVVLVSGNVPDNEFRGLLMHEGLGHFQEITCLAGNKKSGASAFRDGDQPVWNDDPSTRFYAVSWTNEHERKPGAGKEDFVTGYAYKGDSFEDLAESVTYYMTQKDAFRERAATNAALAAKFAWIETHMPTLAPMAKGERWNGTIAWDATKLAFEWTGP